LGNHTVAFHKPIGKEDPSDFRAQLLNVSERHYHTIIRVKHASSVWIRQETPLEQVVKAIVHAELAS
tara:strand:- start:2078 stop:2278 length:201 start_codon:yes stop_codon:yes gene_type:complete